MRWSEQARAIDPEAAFPLATQAFLYLNLQDTRSAEVIREQLRELEGPIAPTLHAMVGAGLAADAGRTGAAVEIVSG